MVITNMLCKNMQSLHSPNSDVDHLNWLEETTYTENSLIMYLVQVPQCLDFLL